MGCPYLGVLDYVYENTTTNSKLRGWIVALHVWNVALDWYGREDAYAMLCTRPESSADVAVAMASRMKDYKINPLLPDSPCYHE